MDTTKNLNFSANIPQLEWERNRNNNTISAYIDVAKKTDVNCMAVIFYTTTQTCQFHTMFGSKIEHYTKQSYTIEEAKRQIQLKFTTYVLSLLNEVAKNTNDSSLTYNDVHLNTPIPRM